MTCVGERIRCGYCGRPISGERKTKRTRSGPQHYVYYRCNYYNRPGHPRTRVTEAELDRQVLAVFDRMRIDDQAVHQWLRAVLRSQTRDAQQESLAQRAELQRQMTLTVPQQDRLLDLRLREQIDEETFARKQQELRDRVARLKLQLDVVDRSHDEMSELAVKVFELSQTLRRQWVAADYAAKRRILEIVFLNCVLDDATLVPTTLVSTTLVPTMRKPSDVLAEGLRVPSSRGDKTAIELFLGGIRSWEAGLRRRVDDRNSNSQREL